MRDLHRVLEPPRRLIFLFKEPCKSAGNYVYMDGACSHADSLEPMACDTEKAVERSSRQFMFKTSRCDRSAAPETLHPNRLSLLKSMLKAQSLQGSGVELPGCLNIWEFSELEGLAFSGV